MSPTLPLIVLSFVCHVGGTVTQTGSGRVQPGQADTATPSQDPSVAEPASARPAASDEGRERDGAEAGKRPRWVPGYPGPWDAALHVARSKDGLAFKPAAGPLIRSADAPTIAWSPDGRLLAVFEYYSRTDRRHFGGLASAYSKDDGKTWSDAMPLVVEGLRRSAGPPRGPALAIRPDGRVELVFVCRDRKARRRVFAAESSLKPSHGRGGAEASGQGEDDKGAAEPRDGLLFKLTGRLKLSDKKAPIDDLAVLFIDEACHVFGTFVEVAGHRYHGISKGGRRFESLDNLHVADVGEQGNAIATDAGYRFYATSPAGIISATSPDGLEWSRESGLRLAGTDVSDPAVVRLKDGSYLMMYVKSPPGARGNGRRSRVDGEGVADAESGHTGETDGGVEGMGETADEAIADNWHQDDTGLAGATDEDGDWSEVDAEGPDDVEAGDGGLDGEPAEADDAAPARDDAAPARDDAPPTPDDTAEKAGLPSPEEESATDGEAGHPPGEAEGVADEAEYYEHEYTEWGVPLPDFAHPVDYRAWLEQCHDPDSVADNAYYHYAAFMLDPDGRPLSASDLPEFQCMFNDATFMGPPAPWKPEDHPLWDESYYATGDLVGMFAEAASHESYVRPATFYERSPEDSQVPEGAEEGGSPRDPLLDNLLINLMLPDLAGHRRMAKETISRAWRSPEGKPDPTAMLDAFDACLGSAEHLGQGDILIEMLVSVAEKGLVESNARWALKHEVFSAEEMEAALDLLSERDNALPAPFHWVTGELAMALDVTQYLCAPTEEGREPTLNRERLKRFNKLFNLDEYVSQPTPDEMASTSAEGVTRNFVEFYSKFAELASRGFPDVKPEDIDAMTTPYAQDNYLSRALLPSLTRVYQLVNRQEASRRATQLTYAIHLHKAQTGQWPESLDDLPPRYTENARTDPFSGQDFVYHKTEDGFKLYSTSENGQDNGGAHHQHWGDKDRDDEEGDDYVFWPPQNP
ncbi:MAG: exo-alpha-sialidase [Phycisphaerae bacterium]|nr:exo-alpha-sialidase [Phycisphaerae bacterium]